MIAPRLFCDSRDPETRGLCIPKTPSARVMTGGQTIGMLAGAVHAPVESPIAWQRFRNVRTAGIRRGVPSPPDESGATIFLRRSRGAVVEATEIRLSNNVAVLGRATSTICPICPDFSGRRSFSPPARWLTPPLIFVCFRKFFILNHLQCHFFRQPTFETRLAWGANVRKRSSQTFPVSEKPQGRESLGFFRNLLVPKAYGEAPPDPLRSPFRKRVFGPRP